MLAAALYLASVIGPHAVILNQQVKDADRQWGRSAPGEFAKLSRPPVAESPGCWTATGTTASRCPCFPGTWSANGSPPDGSPATRCSRSA